MINQTCLWTAYSRALETENDSPLFHDCYAKPLLNYFWGNEYTQYKHLANNPFLIVRTKYFDDYINNSIKDIDQIVILGAGLDSRKLRLNLERTKVFEIDNETIIIKKQNILNLKRVGSSFRRT